MKDTGRSGCHGDDRSVTTVGVTSRNVAGEAFLYRRLSYTSAGDFSPFRRAIDIALVKIHQTRPDPDIPADHPDGLTAFPINVEYPKINSPKRNEIRI